MQWSILARNWKFKEYHSSVLAAPTGPILHEKVYLSKRALQTITPWAGVIVSKRRGNVWQWWWRGLQPGGDLISEISLSLTKLSVKQSFVGNHSGGGRAEVGNS